MKDNYFEEPFPWSLRRSDFRGRSAEKQIGSLNKYKSISETVKAQLRNRAFNKSEVVNKSTDRLHINQLLYINKTVSLCSPRLE
jgi:hypothetical protein